MRPAQFAKAVAQLLLVVGIFVCLAGPLRAADQPQIFPLSQVKPGMTGVAYTIFEGDQIGQG